MSEHYYTSAPTSKSRIRQLEYEYRGEKVLFETDNGVFSKARKMGERLKG